VATKRAFRIGCAGWAIPGAHAAAFPRDGSHLQRYSAVFTAVEINSSFYKPHQRKSYERWAGSVPATFRFSVKMPKQITHTQRLHRCSRLLDDFFAQTAGLGRRLGVVLVQLPPSFAFDRALAKRFFVQVRERYEGAVAIEPRHASWFETRADALLRDAGVSRVAADPALTKPAAHPGGDPRIAYFRLHGSPRMYYSAYAEAFLKTVAQRMREAAGTSSAVWCVFDNTAHGHAVPNAQRLSELLAPQSGRPHS
jgi:uncharacterized protein YecE (DUF72 family)